MKKENKFLIVFFSLLILVALVLAIASIFDNENKDDSFVYDSNIPTTKSNDLNLSSIDSKYINNDYIKGSPDALVTIVEFSDYECPFCVRFYKETYPLIEENYIKTGKVKFVYRDFPLSNHKYAEDAAIAAECSGLQNKYYEMYSLLFTSGVSGNNNTYVDYSRKIGIDESSFKDCINSDTTFNEIEQDYKDGINLGVNSTPSFFINGEEVIGAQSYEIFSEVIERKIQETKYV